MTMQQPNPQRGTGVRKAATGVRPAVPAPAPAPAPQAAAARPGAPRRPGAPAPAGARPALRAPQQEGSGKVGKWMLIVIIILLVGMVGYGFVPRGKNPDGSSKPGLFMALVTKYLPKSTDKPEGGEELPISTSATSAPSTRATAPRRSSTTN